MSPEFAVEPRRPATALNQPGAAMQPGQDLWQYAQAYAREKPDVCALWCFGIGFVLGWKLKPW